MLFDIFSFILSCLAHTFLCSSFLFDNSRGKNPVSYATLSVRGSTMRAWLLPESLNLDALLVDDTPKKSVAPKLVGMADGGRGRGRGRGRGGGGRR
jgi:small nuclear ribonucleoprotein D1